MLSRDFSATFSADIVSRNIWKTVSKIKKKIKKIKNKQLGHGAFL